MNLEQLAANILRSKSDTLRLRCFEGVLFNILRSNGAKTTYDEAKDLALVQPSIYQVLANNNTIRVIMAAYQSGQISKLHRHTDYISYVLDKSKAETSKKGVAKHGEQLIFWNN